MIADVEVRREHGLVLPAQERGDLRGEASQRRAVRVDDKPGPRDVAALRRVRLHHFLLIRLVMIFARLAPRSILDRDEAQAVRRRARTRLRAIARRRDAPERRDVDRSATHPEERAQDAADHPSKERVRGDLEAEQRTVATPFRSPSVTI